jgi:hypothetical protein
METQNNFTNMQKYNLQKNNPLKENQDSCKILEVYN